MRVTLIHHPGAGAAPDRDALLELLRDAGHDVRYQSCEDEDWSAALEAPAELVAVAAGDGTVSRVAKKLVDAGTPMTILPAGTANNISRTLGLVERPWEDLVQGWGDGARRVKLDVGVAEGPWGRRYFVEGVGVGLFAAGMPEAEDNATLQTLDRRDAKVAYAQQLLKERIDRCDAVSLAASLDGRDVSGDYVLLEAMNLPYVGPNLYLAPDSKQGDGHLDVVTVTAAECDRMRHYLEHWQEEKPRLAVLPSHRGKRLKMRWTGFFVHIDDEVWPPEEGGKSAADIDIRLAGRSVEFLVPDQTSRLS